MAEQRHTISDVARCVGVSRSLISFVFDDRPGVATETRERILAAPARWAGDHDPALGSPPSAALRSIWATLRSICCSAATPR